MQEVVIGTRSSRLALIQADMVCSALKTKLHDISFLVKTIKTTGDVITDIPLEKINDKGIFIKELENALLDGEIDLAVHSMKDMPTELPPGLQIGAVLEREKPWDVFIGNPQGTKITDLETGAKIGSSSLRRRAQLKHHYPHLDICSIRGNIETRYRKLKEGQFDGLILAYAGVARMGWLESVSEVLPGNVCLPAVGQGAIGVEARIVDRDLLAMISNINCPLTSATVKAERAFLKKLEGGCQIPVGALGVIENDLLMLTGLVASLDGSIIFRATEKGNLEEADAVGLSLAGKLLQQGCGTILEQIKMECIENEY